jgi:hypothetical protein
LELGRNCKTLKLKSMKFEYTMTRVNLRDPQKTNADLNKLGEEGWELAAIFPYDSSEGIAFLKREKRG